MLRHPGEKPYSCQVFGSVFSQSTNFKIHIQEHICKKQYSWEVSGSDEVSGFSDNSQLISHMLLKDHVLVQSVDLHFQIIHL